MSSKQHSLRGFTLVELIVVLAIVALLSALAIPGITRLVSSDDQLSRTSRELYELLAAARIYAITYNVRTAVVYSLDNYSPPDVNPNNDPMPGTNYILDSVTGQQVRYINAAAFVYELPQSRDRFFPALREIFLTEPDKLENAFVYALGREGQWKQFDESIALLMMDSPTNPNRLYFSDRPRFDPSGNSCSELSEVGMYCGLPVILDFESLVGAQVGGATSQAQAQYLDRFPAHVFTPDGELKVTVQTKERYTFYMGYRPDETFDRRLTNPDYPTLQYSDPDTGDLVDNLRVVPIEIFRSTGRVKIAS